MRSWNLAWVGGVAAALLTVTAAVGGILKNRRSEMTLTPVSDQWLADHKREREHPH